MPVQWYRSITKKRGRPGRQRKNKSRKEDELTLPLTEETDFQFWFNFIRKINARAGIELTILSNGESAVLKIS